MSSIRNVAVVDATGSIGRRAIPALLDAKFAVAVVTYTSEGKSFPPQVRVAVTDFSPESLHEVLTGQDAVLCVLGHAVCDRHIDDTKGPNDVAEYHAILGKKAQAQNLLEELAKENSDFTWTSFWNGPLLDRANSGNERFTAMSISKIGKPMAAVVKHPEETKKQFVRLSALTTSQRAILTALERLTDTKWDTTTVSIEEARREGKIKLQNGDYKGANVGFLVAQLYEDRARRSVLDGADNELLEVEPEELDDVIRKALAWV
ncbi:NmrA-like family protein [Colletotrichum salicis]|uniref:NmrA-like family protein n=1 Tax=Colletotrichum salicis TaxID=1209931 RepID=A0A135T5L2_9PEZI|nr:NmrA-like family protein [Colletotrichum salicis]